MNCQRLYTQNQDVRGSSSSRQFIYTKLRDEWRLWSKINNFNNTEKFIFYFSIPKWLSWVEASDSAVPSTGWRKEIVNRDKLMEEKSLEWKAKLKKRFVNHFQHSPISSSAWNSFRFSNKNRRQIAWNSSNLFFYSDYHKTLSKVASMSRWEASSKCYEVENDEMVKSKKWQSEMLS